MTPDLKSLIRRHWPDMLLTAILLPLVIATAHFIFVVFAIGVGGLE